MYAHVLRLPIAGRLPALRIFCGARRISATNAMRSPPSDETAPAEPAVLRKLRESFVRDEAAGLVVPVYKRALLYGDRTAIKDDGGGEYTYLQLYGAAKRLSFQLSNLCASGSSSKIALLTTNTTLHTVAQWACWFSGQIVVPLSPKHPASALHYYLTDSRTACIICDAAHHSLVQPLADTLAIPLIVIEPTLLQPNANTLDPSAQIALTDVGGTQFHLEGAQPNHYYSRARPAMILYTSGSTGPPKGTVITHRNLAAQTASLRSAWQITAADALLHVLPLNHVHGCVNALLMPLNVGAKLVAHSRFDAGAVWAALLNVNHPTKDRISVFMAVPTIYALLLAEYDKVFAHNARMVDFIRAQCEKRIRLMVSGSAPLPASVFHRWSEVTGHQLLERYGMTECGMALSNPYRVDRVRSRQPGRVGVPLPGAEVKLVRSDGQTVCYAKGQEARGWWSEHELPAYGGGGGGERGEDIAPATEDMVGELYVKGPTVFAEYLNRPEETAAAFANGWFRTGDEARYEGGTFQILGRKSVDIIKTGGYKVSALEVETYMLDHPSVRDVCVVGVPDMTWGQRVAAVVQRRVEENEGEEVEDEEASRELAQERQQVLQAFCREHLAAYQVPVEFRWVKKLPRNAMGKVNKRTLLAELFGVGQAMPVETATVAASEAETLK